MLLQCREEIIMLLLKIIKMKKYTYAVVKVNYIWQFMVNKSITKKNKEIAKLFNLDINFVKVLRKVRNGLIHPVHFVDEPCNNNYFIISEKDMSILKVLKLEIEGLKGAHNG